MKKRVEILSDKSALVERSLALITDQVTTTLGQQDRFTIALAGGSTPKPIYEGLAKKDLPWSKLHIFWGDERYVSPAHADSNEGMARKAWLDQVNIPADNIHGTPTGAENPAIDAQSYEGEIRQVFQSPVPEIPSFDLILLGMGDDGHTASLFPHTEALKVSDRLITVGNKDGQPRLTFTVPLINQARCVMFLVAGENKRPALTQVFAKEGDSSAYPSRLIQPQGELWWLLDQAAGTVISEQ
jgi:6-phosphogluconolactonase